MRYTNTSANGCVVLDNDSIDKAVLKLREIEDIEEELGVDFITLYKALKNGIWTRGGFYSYVLRDEPHFVEKPEIGIEEVYMELNAKTGRFDVMEENAPCIYEYDEEEIECVTRLKDYGRTWALTKEELEEGK